MDRVDYDSDYSISSCEINDLRVFILAASILSMLQDFNGILQQEDPSVSRERKESCYEMLKIWAHLKSSFFSHQEPSKVQQ